MEEMEKVLRKVAKDLGLKVIKRNYITITDPHGSKHIFKLSELSKALIMVNNYDPDREPIYSPSCAFGSEGTAHIRVRASDCSIKREDGFIPSHKLIGTEEDTAMCTCYWRSGYHDVIPKCQYYNRTEEIQKPIDWQKRFRVHCFAPKTTVQES